MESFNDDPDKEKPEPRGHEPFKRADYVNRDFYLARSAKVMIIMRPQNSSHEDDSPPVSEEDPASGNTAPLGGKDDPVSGNTAPPDSKDNREDGTVSGNTAPAMPDLTADAQNNQHNNQLLFCGVVRDDHNSVIESAPVMVFACYKGGMESLLGHTFTDSDGVYVVNIPKPADYRDLTGFKVLAGQGRLPSVRNDSPAGRAEKHDIRSPNKGFYDFLKLISNSPGKNIFELLKGFN